MGGFRLDGRTIAIGAFVILALIVGVILLNRNNNDAAPIDPTQPGTAFGDPVVPGSGATTGGVVLGRLVTASNVDGDGCPVDTTDQFSVNDEVYVVIEDSDIPAGTTVFARLFRENTPVEDADTITADQNYDNTCIYFVFEPTTTAEVLEAGFYEAQVIVNGNPGERVGFEIR